MRDEAAEWHLVIDNFPLFDDDYLYDMPENETQPLSTTSVNLGFTTAVVYDLSKTVPELKPINPLLLMIHSPFEVQTKENQKFFVVEMDYDTFFVTPQLTTIDDSMFGMRPHE